MLFNERKFPGLQSARHRGLRIRSPGWQVSPGSPPIPFSRAWTRLRTREITPYLWVQPDENGEPRFLGRLGRLVLRRPSWTGDELISRHPS